MNVKALPPRPGTRDGPAQNNGNRPGAKGLVSPSGNVVLEGYRGDMLNGFAEEKARYNPMNTNRTQSSMLLNINDPIQVHLLVETALGDSKEYEILSQEEVDDLKRQCQSLTQRIEQTQQNLKIQSKYRDAAISMAKLYSPTEKRDGKRRIIPHHKTDSVKEADIERMRSEERCEELALELWSLEKRLIEPQSRLLKHTAGILQMTHKGPKKTSKGQGEQQQGIPGSPESMYTYHNSRNSVEPLPDMTLFDDRSLYRDADRLDDYGERETKDIISEAAPLSPPPRAQGREQMQSILKTAEKLGKLNARLREVIISANPEQEDIMDLPPPIVNSPGRSMDAADLLSGHLEYMEMGINAVDQEQNRLNMSIRALVQKKEELLAEQDESSKRLEESGSRVQELDQRLQETARLQGEVEQIRQEADRRQEESDAAMEETIDDMNREIRSILLPYDPNRPEIPELTGRGLQDQLIYFQQSVGAIEMELSRANTSNANKGMQDNAEQMETILMGLWDIIQSGYGEIRKRKEERRLTRSANGLPADEDDMSADEGGDPDEPFSLQAFSTKVQWLYAQATKLKDQKKVLQIQIKQQRELNSKSDASKDAEMIQKVEELQRTQALLVRTEADADNVRTQLSEVMEKLDELRQQELLRDQKRVGDESTAVRETQEELERRNQTISELEEELQELKDDQSIAEAETQSKLTEAESRIAALSEEMAAAISAKAASESLVAEKDASIFRKEREMDEMNMKLAELQTEVTIARAELDGAYGSRSQRAAEVASNPVIQRELDTLARNNVSLAAELAALKDASASAGQGSKESDEKMQILKRELAETIEEYEEMTKASIEWEKDRERLEETIDKLRNERERVEAELSDERVRWLGMRSPGMDGGMSTPGAGATSTSVLKDEFKKMMRTTRAESAKALRAEQAERRRLEDELRALKRAQGPGKSGLSQSVRSPI